MPTKSSLVEINNHAIICYVTYNLLHNHMYLESLRSLNNGPENVVVTSYQAPCKFFKKHNCIIKRYNCSFIKQKTH